MYKVFIKNLEGFKKIFYNDERLKLSKPLFLLNDIKTFKYHKEKGTDEYKNLYLIINRADELKSTSKYHSFGMFLNELYLQYYDFNSVNDINISEEILQYQVDLLHQFMFPAYYQS